MIRKIFWRLRIPANRLAILAAAALTLLSAAAYAEGGPKETTLKGTLCCAKCSLHEPGVTTCTDVLQVKDGDKTINYYLTQSSNAKTALHVCAGTKENVSVTGVVSEKDGKQTFAASKIEADGSGVGIAR